jgi:hypothetical protein
MSTSPSCLSGVSVVEQVSNGITNLETLGDGSTIY